MPDLIGNYEVSVLDVLGIGHFGQVYKATHQITKDIAAIKQIQLSHDDVDAHDSYLHDLAELEIDTLKTLTHPNIVKYITHIVQNDSVYIVTEYCDLGHIGKYLKSNPNLQIHVKARLVLESAQAVAYMHGQKSPIIHRDIKIENILIKTEGCEATAKLSDFGLAKVLDKSDFKIASHRLWRHQLML